MLGLLFPSSGFLTLIGLAGMVGKRGYKGIVFFVGYSTAAQLCFGDSGSLVVVG